AKNIPVSIILKISLKNKFKLIIREAVDPKHSSITQRSFFSRFLINNIKGFLYPKSDNIIAISEGVKQSLIKNFKLDSSKIKTIYNPSSDEKILSLAQEEIGSDLLSGKPLIISVGRLTKQKDHITLLKAFNEIYSKIDCNLYIVGEGSERDNLEKFIRNNNIEDRVKLLGYQNNPWKFMSKSELFILPSIWEGFGNVIVEAMLIGIPVISSDCPSGPREILNDGVNGKLFKVGDYSHLAKIIEDVLSDDNSELINRAKIRSRDFTIEKITEEYEKVLSY
ncbi:MAG: glycosyltransferase, partial [Chloroflexota bacterium]|nr:glycosyltransferase [Chloroflexota bacterium]